MQKVLIALLLLLSTMVPVLAAGPRSVEFLLVEEYLF